MYVSQTEVTLTSEPPQTASEVIPPSSTTSRRVPSTVSDNTTEYQGDVDSRGLTGSATKRDMLNIVPAVTAGVVFLLLVGTLWAWRRYR